MSATVKVIEGPYFRDLMAQPAALDATLAWLASEGRWRGVCDFLRARPWQRIVLTGMGSSYYSLHPLSVALIDAGFAPVTLETAELVHYALRLCDEDTLIVTVSQSGGSAETLRLLEVNQRSTILGVTNTPQSRLAEAAHHVLSTQAGPEFSVSCKTYVTALLALQWLSAAFRGQDAAETLRRLAPASRLVDDYLREWRAHTAILTHELRGIRHLFFAGRGSSLAAVGTGALIVKEAAHVHAEGMTSAAFRHGPMEMLQDDMLTVVFTGEQPTRALNRRLARQLTAAGRRCAELGSESAVPALRIPECDPVLKPIVEILPVQMMTLALAGLAGREAGCFEHASKVTDTE